MIRNAQGDLFEAGPKTCDAIVVWGRATLNVFAGTYQAFVERLRGHTLSRAGATVTLGAKPWADDFAATPISVEPPLERLRIVYFLANPTEADGLADAELESALGRALEQVAASGAESVALNSVRPLGRGTSTAENQALDNERVRLSRAICERWIASHPTSPLKEIHFVSMNDAFMRT